MTIQITNRSLFEGVGHSSCSATLNHYEGRSATYSHDDSLYGWISQGQYFDAFQQGTNMSLAPSPPVLQEIIAVSDRGKCEVDFWLLVDGRLQHCSTKDMDHGQSSLVVSEIANRFFRDVLGKMQATNRYIFNLTPNHMMARQFEFQNGDAELKACHSIEKPRDHRATMSSLSAHLLELFSPHHAT